MKKQALNISSILLLSLVLVVCVNMGTGNDSKYSPKSNEPAFASLENKQGNYEGQIIDESSTSNVFNLSFYGHTSIGGILKETDDSVNTLDISKIKEIIIEKQNYDSTRYRDKDLTLASVISIDGTQTKNLLFPRRVTICGEEKKSNIKRSWFISKLDKIVINHAAVQTSEKEKTKQETETTTKNTNLEKEEKKENTEKATKTNIETSKEKSTSVTTTTTKASSTSGVTNSDLEEKKQKGVLEAFMGIIDSVIDFVKSIIHFFMSLVR